MEKFNELLSKHRRASQKIINYGTAGFRDKYETTAIGVMITASHNPEADNGLKLIDPHGEMLENSWESIATNIANVIDEHLQQTVNEIIGINEIDMTLEATVYLGRDTRNTSVRFAEAVADGISAANGTIYNFDLLTTPQLHYMVLCKNSGKAYGEPSENGYYKKLANSFITLNGKDGAHNSVANYLPSIQVDGANGVGAIKLKQMMAFLGNSIDITLHNTGEGILNHECGADYVKVNQRQPKSLVLETAKRYASFDGDADRIIYYYKNSSDGKFHMLDGDKIAVLLAAHISDLLIKAQLISKLELCIVQTAYANGSSTSYIEDILKIPVSCVPTGVKHLHHRAQQSDIGIYFEANGHGTVVFSEKAKRIIKEASSLNDAKKLLILIDLINETVGDAISDMLVVETILRSRGESAEDWDNLYQDLPNRLLKVNVADRNTVTTGDAERKCLTPEGLQNAIDVLVAKYGPKSRSFVRPSGTEDVVRVYAEALTQEKADDLAKEVANAVFDLSGGVGNKY